MLIARQPIFNRKLDVFGYELLYREDIKSHEFDGISSASATACVMGGLFESGVNNIVEDKYAFVNFDENFIFSDAIEIVTPDRLIIEMLEDVKVNNSLMARLKELKKRGYRIALDDFIADYDDYPLVPLADIIKFDLIATPLESIGGNVNQALRQNKILLAEKVETKEEFLKAKEMGFHLFQGYFFSRPSISCELFDKSISKYQYISLIEELKKDRPSYQTLTELIETDIHLSYRLMRVVSLRAGDDLIYSIKKAVIYMGLEELERWINILMLQDLGQLKHQELIKISLIRTKFAESIALYGGLENIKHEASMMGLFSVVDVLFDQTMAEALEDIALSNSIVDALINKTGELYPIYELLLAYEKGDWIQASYISRSLGLDESILYKEYLSAIKWANEVPEL
ncbi:MAG TPA: EAL domain-containing protein [Syntrophomonadaceae bacterium]|nr:EAL domain-containing protein [Syntrophomonadaceae bacterium]